MEALRRPTLRFTTIPKRLLIGYDALVT